MRTAADTLAIAAALLVEKGWTKGACARRADGREVHSSDPDAASFCVVGAVCLAGHPPVGHTHAAFPFIQEVIGVSRVSGWNDAIERTKDEVVGAIDAAYVLALQEEGLEPEDVL